MKSQNPCADELSRIEPMADKSKREEQEDLSVSEKILLVQDLWDDIARSSARVNPTAAQLEEAERRLREHEANPGTYATWEEIRRRLQNRR